MDDVLEQTLETAINLFQLVSLQTKKYVPGNEFWNVARF